MKYRINESVLIVKTKKLKKIIDCEIISNIKIYYMDDGTSYSENEIINENCLSIDDFLTKNEEKISKILNKSVKNISDGFSKFWLENKHLIDYVN